MRVGKDDLKTMKNQEANRGERNRENKQNNNNNKKKKRFEIFSRGNT